VPRRVEGMPEPVWRVVQACMDKRPACRPSAEDLVTTLRSLARKTKSAPALPPAPDDDAADDDEPALDAAAAVPRPRRPTAAVLRSWGLFALAVLVGVVVFTVPGLRLLDGGPFNSRRADDRHRSTAPAQAASGGHTSTAPGFGTTGSIAPSTSAPPSTGPVQFTVGGSGSPPVQATVYGPWQCPDTFAWDIGHPVLAKPCHALGGEIRIIGYMQALPGVQADVSLTLFDAATGEVKAGPFSCAALMFTDTASEHSCGPFETAVPHGHRYVVVEKWQYTGRGILPTGSTRGVEFTW
jgi:serine/threonine protein kinase, bacterial